MGSVPYFKMGSVPYFPGYQTPGIQRFTAQHAALEPDGASDQHDQRKPRPERDRKASEKDEMAEIHGIAGVAKGPGGDDPLRRDLHAGAAAGTWMPIAPDQEILQIAP